VPDRRFFAASERSDDGGRASREAGRKALEEFDAGFGTGVSALRDAWPIGWRFSRPFFCERADLSSLSASGVKVLSEVAERLMMMFGAGASTCVQRSAAKPPSNQRGRHNHRPGGDIAGLAWRAGDSSIVFKIRWSFLLGKRGL
jgi:hypothetical protein